MRRTRGKFFFQRCATRLGAPRPGPASRLMPFVLIGFLTLPFFACPPVSAQANPQIELQRALTFVQKGQFSEAINTAKPLIDSGALHGAELGRSWALLGFAYGEQGSFGPARHALDQSIALLDHNPDFVDDYAVALDYLATLDRDESQLDAAQHVWLKALKICQARRNHAFIAVTYRHLAELELRQHRVHPAKKYFQKATSEVSLAGDWPLQDRAAYALTQGWLALEEKHSTEAVQAYERSLELYRTGYGDSHFLTGWAYVLLGDARSQAGQVEEALRNMRQGVAILDRALGRQNPMYWVAQIAYSQVLDVAGSHSAASQLRESGQEALKNLYQQQCLGCAVSVSSLH